MEDLMNVENLDEMKEYCENKVQARKIWKAMTNTSLSDEAIEKCAAISATAKFHESVLTRVEIKREESKFEQFEKQVLELPARLNTMALAS